MNMILFQTGTALKCPYSICACHGPNYAPKQTQWGLLVHQPDNSGAGRFQQCSSRQEGRRQGKTECLRGVGCGEGLQDWGEPMKEMSATMTEFFHMED